MFFIALFFVFFFQAEDGIRDQPRSRGLGDVYKRQFYDSGMTSYGKDHTEARKMLLEAVQEANLT